MKLSIIIPVYNGERTLPTLVQEIKSTLGGFNYEIILVYDCGKDNSWPVIKKLKFENEDILKAVRLSRNFGQHNATICGIKHASGDFIITMDEDLQHSPASIPDFLARQKEQDCDLVYGKYAVKQHSVFRNSTSVILKKLLKIGVPDLHPDYSSYRLIKTSIAKKVLAMNNSYTFLDGYLSWITTNVSSIPVNHEKRMEGKSAYSLIKLVNHSINIFVTFSELPIRCVTFTSLLIFAAFSVYAATLILRKIIYNDIITGFTSVMVVLGLGIGLILLSIGIVGEYLHKINLKTTQRPNFNEAEVL